MTSDIEAVRRRGFGSRVGFGEAPALVVIDFIRAFTDPGHRLGADVSRELAQTNLLLEAAHRAGAPVILSTVAYDDPVGETGVWLRKMAGLADLVAGSVEVEQDPRLAIGANDTILRKRFASCFFKTTLADDLRRQGIDTVIIAGCTTSGCVRATAVDACCHGFHTIVARDAVADRLQDAHEQSLTDIDLKYGDVLPAAEIVGWLDSRARCQAEA